MWVIGCGALNEKRKPAPLAASQSASMLPVGSWRKVSFTSTEFN